MSLTRSAAIASGAALAGSYWAVALAASPPGRVVAGSSLLSSVRTQRRVVALTFDDGPDPEWTPKFVEALGPARSTFFVLGEAVRRAPEVARAAVVAGHEVACHGDRHRKLTRLSPQETTADLRSGYQTITCATGTSPRFFRPAHGVFNLSAWRECSRLGMRRTLWSGSAKDWSRDATSRSVTERVLAAARPGAVILMHDSGGWPGRPATTFAALPDILEGLKRLGLEPVTLTELVGG